MRRLLYLLLIKQAVFCSLDYETEDQIKDFIAKLVKRENGELEVEKTATESSLKDSDVFYIKSPKASKYINPDLSNQNETEAKLDNVAARTNLKRPISISDRTDPPDFEEFISKPTKKKSADKNGEDLDEILKLMTHPQFDYKKLKFKNSEPTRDDEPLSENTKPNVDDDSEEQGGSALFRSDLPEHKVDSILQANRHYKKPKEMLRNGYMESEPEAFKQKIDGAYEIDLMLNKLQQENLETPLSKHSNAFPNQTPYIEPQTRGGQVYGPPVVQPPCGSMICSNPLLEAPIVHQRAHKVLPEALKQTFDGGYEMDWMFNKLKQEHLETPSAKLGYPISNQTPYKKPTTRGGQGYGPPVIQPPCGSKTCINPLHEAPIGRQRTHEARNILTGIPDILTGIPVASMGVFQRPVHRTVIYG